MTDLNHLRCETEKALYGLKADDLLKQRILQSAAEKPKKNARKNLQLIPVMCAVAAALLFSVLLLNGIPPVTHPEPGNINAFTAGGDQVLSVLPGQIEEEKILSIELEGRTPIRDRELCASLAKKLRNEAVRTEKIPDPSTSAKTMTLKMDNGEQIQLFVMDPYVWSDGDVYECPGFFELLEQSD